MRYVWAPADADKEEHGIALCRYSEASEAEGPVDAALGAFGHTIVHLVATVPWLRRTVRGMLPKPGDGPPEGMYREKNHWKFTLYGWTAEEGKGERPRQCQVCCFTPSMDAGRFVSRDACC